MNQLIQKKLWTKISLKRLYYYYFYIESLFSDFFFNRQINFKLNKTYCVGFINEFNNF